MRNPFPLQPQQQSDPWTQLHRLCSPADCLTVTRSNQGLLLHLEDLEHDLFWEPALEKSLKAQYPAVVRDTSASPSDPSEEDGSAVDYDVPNPRLLKVPDWVGHRNRLTVWQAAFSRLIEHAVWDSVKLDVALERRRLPRGPKLQGLRFTTPHQAFRDSAVSSFKCLRLASLFHSRASRFAVHIIERHLLQLATAPPPPCQPASSASSSNQEFLLQGPEQLDPVPLPNGHFLSSLRLFDYDKVFVSATPESEPGGGLLGIVVLGDSVTSVRCACKYVAQQLAAGRTGWETVGAYSTALLLLFVSTCLFRIYGKDLKAHRYLNGHILGLKHRYALARLQAATASPPKKTPVKHRADEGPSSSTAWLQDPLSLLTPRLVTLVDYRGFRVAVHPLPYRPPIQLTLTSYTFQSRLGQELFDTFAMASVNGLLQHPKHPVQLLQLEGARPALVVFNQGHNTLLRIRRALASEIAGQHDTAAAAAPINYIQPTLLQVHRYFKSPATHAATESADHASPYDDRIWRHFGFHSSLSRNARSPETTSEPPFVPCRIRDGLDVSGSPFAYAFRTESGDSAEAASNIEALHTFLLTVSMPRALKALEQQPFHAPADSATLRKWLLDTGHNCRQLGTLLRGTRHLWIQQLLVVEIVARTLKNLFQDIIREKILNSSLRSLSSTATTKETLPFQSLKQAATPHPSVATALSQGTPSDDVLH